MALVLAYCNGGTAAVTCIGFTAIRGTRCGHLGTIDADVIDAFVAVDCCAARAAAANETMDRSVGNMSG